jgi:hypothetical protein
MHSTRSMAIFVCVWLSSFPASSPAQEEKAPDKTLATDLELLQGKWELFHGNEGGAAAALHSVKEIKGSQETLRRYDAKTGKLIREHTVEFALARSGDVRVFTFYAVGGDPKQGLSFVYKVDADNFYDISGVLQGDAYRNYQESPHVWHWKKVKAVSPAKPAAPEPPPRAQIDPAQRKKLELLGARISATTDGYNIDIRSRSNVTDKEIGLIAQCPQVVELTLENTAITDQGLEKLRPIKQLRRLILNDCAISAAGLEILAGLPLHETVTSLGLRGTKIKGDDMKWLKDFSSLQRLDVSGTQVTDDSLPALQTLPLQVLNVTGAPLSAAALEKFQKEHPKVVVKK